MYKYIAAFRSRSQTMRLFQTAKSGGISCAIINTPREASIGCGISLSYEPQSHYLIQSMVSRGGFNAFIGFYSMERMPNGSMRVEKI